jgi:hypothetical protein
MNNTVSVSADAGSTASSTGSGPNGFHSFSRPTKMSDRSLAELLRSHVIILALIFTYDLALLSRSPTDCFVPVAKKEGTTQCSLQVPIQEKD